MSYSTIPKLLVLALQENATVEAAVSNRIHYQQLPQKSIYPHIYLARSGREADDLLDGEDGIVVERYVAELVASVFDEDLCNAVQLVLNNLECTYEGVTVHVTDLEDVDDNYVFKSADSDALFLHGFRIAVYFTEVG
jgi:hypothetical protein